MEKWWLEKTEKWKAINALIVYYKSTQRLRIAKYKLNLRLYADIIQNEYDTILNVAGINRNGPKITMNICKSACDTLASKIAKNKINPMVLTEKGNWTKQRQAKKLDKIVRTLLLKNKVQGLMRQCFLDSVIFGSGFLKVFKLGSEVTYERILPEEIFVDELDGIYGKPKSLFQVRQVDRQCLIGLFPEKEEEIKKAPVSKSEVKNSEKTKSDLVEVIESWRLKSYGSEGNHCISLATCMLSDEPYEEEDFPFVVLNWSKLPKGFFGQSVVDELCDSQVEINKTLYFIQQNFLFNQPKWIVQENGAPSGHFTNQPGTIMKYTGMVPPVYVAPAPVPSITIDYLRMLISDAYQKVGISEMSARSEKPAGLNSGKALQTFNDIESERFVLASQAFEEAFVDIFYKTVKACKEIAEEDPSFSIMSLDPRRGLEEINWSEIDFEKDKYIFQVFPISTLPSEPAARINYVENLMVQGLLDREAAMELLDFPDMEAYKSVEFADTLEIKESLDLMIDKGVYIAPDEYSNLKKAVGLAQRYYLKLKVELAPLETLDLVSTYIQECKSLMDEVQMQMPVPEAPVI